MGEGGSGEGGGEGRGGEGGRGRGGGRRSRRSPTEVVVEDGVWGEVLGRNGG